MEYSSGIYQLEPKRSILLLCLIAATHLLLQYLVLPYGPALRSLFPDGRGLKLDGFYTTDRKDGVGFDSGEGPTEATLDRNNSLMEDIVDNSMFDNVAVENGSAPGESSVLYSNSLLEESVLPPDKETLTGDTPSESEGILISSNDTSQSRASSLMHPQEMSPLHSEDTRTGNSSKSTKSLLRDDAVDFSLVEDAEKELPENEKQLPPKSDLDATLNRSRVTTSGRRKKLKKNQLLPTTVTSIAEMNRILAGHMKASLSMKPRWSSAPDREILGVKSKIISDPASKIDEELYAPLFRNVYMFSRSYELMERTLKVYVYRDGGRPIFHQPILKGLYASEGWFMKQMEGNRRFVVKNPKKAHLFYMPLSFKMLEDALYVEGSHNMTNLKQYVRKYRDKIAAKYPYWNRTGGTDHFLVGCHDWAPYETRHHMDNCIKALCNADTSIGFKIGQDISLPETLIRYARNPVRYTGGKPASQRNILAFYSGNNHGYLRPILLKHWKDKNDPEMRIFGPLPSSVAKKMNYIQYMKSSKYCLCPRGFEVNSPRIVEAIMFECVPVIISDNFVPPFFEVLNWDAFSIIMSESDVPRLKEILLSISRAKYFEMQLAVRKVQRHFLWHYRSVKYDLFHMTLHSIWYSRVFQT